MLLAVLAIITGGTAAYWTWVLTWTDKPLSAEGLVAIPIVIAGCTIALALCLVGLVLTFRSEK